MCKCRHGDNKQALGHERFWDTKKNDVPKGCEIFRLQFNTSNKMSTPNFLCRNASRIFAITDEEGYDLRDKIEDFTFKLFDLGFDPCNDSCNGSYSYPCMAIGEKTVSEQFGQLEFQAVIKVKVTSGYYSGACFDFDVELIDLSSYMPKYDWSIGDENEDFKKSIFDSIDETYNKGLAISQYSIVYGKLEKKIFEVISEAEKMFAEFCDMKLACVGIFSNGEAIYEEV